MRRLSIRLAFLSGRCVALCAHTDPLSTEARGAWTRIGFRDIIAHNADSAMGSCVPLSSDHRGK